MVTIHVRSLFQWHKGFALLLASLLFAIVSPAEAARKTPARRHPTAESSPRLEVTGPALDVPLYSPQERIDSLEERVKKLEAETDELRQTQLDSNIRIHDFSGIVYLKGGLELLFPQQSTFTYATDSGLGVTFGGGAYLTHDHVVDVSFQWDVHLAAALRYRYEIHSPKNFFSWGPTGGVRAKIASVRPFDNFVQPTEVIQSVFMMAGAFASLTIPGGQIFFEVVYSFNTQRMIVATTGLQLFL